MAFSSTEQLNMLLDDMLETYEKSEQFIDLPDKEKTEAYEGIKLMRKKFKT